MAQKRAKVGGEVGMNGEFYSGGEFLPNTELRSQHKEKSKAGSKKQQIEPYVWVVPPADHLRSIYGYIAGIFGNVDRNTGKLRINCSDQTINYYKADRVVVEELVAQYNNGERWF